MPDLWWIDTFLDIYKLKACVGDVYHDDQFISDRFNNGESVIFVAQAKDRLKGFVQMYPSFCSVDAIKIFILYDLYVDEDDRQSGIGELLMKKATKFAKAEGASRIDLLTAFDNRSAQHLYEKLGYKRDLEDFYAYY